MNKRYNPKQIEEKLYKIWEKKGYFKPNINNNAEKYSIILPPPNVTGNLHLGHAFQQTIMDIIIRYQRMQGKKTLWQPGIDHAGIATQMIIEKKIIEEEGKTSKDYTRNEFIEKIWQWVEKSQHTILNQMRRLGCSLDWSNIPFTMDKNISYSVKEVFIKLYKDNLIYHSKNLVNWDTKLQTAISDLEVEHRDSKGLVWYLRYHLAKELKNKKYLKYLIIATTRPETILGDTAIAINPKDTRYNHLIGQYIVTPIIKRLIPIISDDYVDMKQGTGCMKITPAHDFNDYKIGKKHNLSIINIMNYDGKIKKQLEILDYKGNVNTTSLNEVPKFLRDIDRFDARKKIVKELDNLGLIQNVEIQNISIPYGDRSGTIIEPMITKQWYLKTKELSKNAIQAINEEHIKFIPKRYEKIYFNWMNNIQDWCISRQLWWGHNIPVWYDNNNKVYVGHNEKEIRIKYKIKDNIYLHKDEDVLDTWFSSSIWTFASLGWPKNINKMQTFHPTDLIVSGFDIIFFWIARMIMLTMHIIKKKNNLPEIPFKTIYITGLIRDETGQKMSKSKGNIIDPIDIIDGISKEELLKKRINNIRQKRLIETIKINTNKQFPNGIIAHGADTLRFTMTSLATNSQDITWNMSRLNGYRNFCNKLWHASRFVLLNTTNLNYNNNKNNMILSLADRWIISKFHQTIKRFRNALDNYRVDLASNILYEFVWHQFCDWYIELSKQTLQDDNNTKEKTGTQYTMITLLEALLRLAHPIIPFITETIWQKAKIIINNKNDTIMYESFPNYNNSKIDKHAMNEIEWIKKITVSLRAFRKTMNIKNNEKLNISIINYSSIIQKIIKNNLKTIRNIAKLETINFLKDNDLLQLHKTIEIETIKILIHIKQSQPK